MGKLSMKEELLGLLRQQEAVKQRLAEIAQEIGERHGPGTFNVDGIMVNINYEDKGSQRIYSAGLRKVKSL